MSTSVDRIARDLLALRRDLRKMQTQPQLAFSSIDGGFLVVRDDDGNDRQVIGAQEDGTVTITDRNGPPPPIPAAPSLSVATPGLLIVTSYGLTSDGSEWPLDLKAIEVHVSQTDGFIPNTATKVAQFAIDGGSAPVALPEGTWYAVLVAVNTSGVSSVPSTQVSGLVTRALETTSGVDVYFTPTEPVGSIIIGSIWYDTDDGNHPHYWDGAAWQDIQDQAIVAAQSTADGKNTVTYSTVAPTDEPNVDGDIWFVETLDGIITGHHRGLGGTSWSEVTLGSSVIDNLDAGKITTGFLEAGRLASDAIDGMTITGATFIGHDSAGNVTVLIDGETGNVTAQGEFGTSPPEDAGVHISSNEFNGMYGQATYPTIEFNNGSQYIAGNRQPKIFTDTSGNSNLYLWAGAAATTRLAQVKLDAARARIGLELNPGTFECDGDRIDVSTGFITLATSGVVQITNRAQSAFGDLEMQDLTVWGKVDVSENISVTGDIHVTGHLNSDSELQCNGSLQTSASGYQITSAGGASFKPIAASAFNVNSDARVKTNETPVIGALDVIDALPVYDYDTVNGPGRGVMAQDVAKVLPDAVQTLSEDRLVVDIYALLSTTIAGMQELRQYANSEIAALKQEVAELRAGLVA